jgi:hypothetical protein
MINMTKKIDREIRKNYKTFFTNLLVCLIIKSVMENHITISEVYAIIDKISDAKRKERIEKQRQREISIANERFQRITQRFNQGRINREHNNEDYKSYFSINKVD